MSNLKFPLARRVLIWVLLTGGAYLTVSGLMRATLMLVGRTAIGGVEYSVRAYGMSRGTVYRVHYDFEADGRTWHDEASTVAEGPPAGAMKVRYLNFLPQINGPDNMGYLSIGLLARLIPAIFLVFSGLVLLQER